MVNLRLIYPQEVEVLYILPALRRELTIQLKKLGLEQKKIAKLLSITEPAVSQYVKSKRASGIKFDAGIKKRIEAAAGRIKDKGNIVEEMQGLVGIALKEKLTCRVHKGVSNIPKNCTACFKTV